MCFDCYVRRIAALQNDAKESRLYVFTECFYADTWFKFLVITSNVLSHLGLGTRPSYSNLRTEWCSLSIFI